MYRVHEGKWGASEIITNLYVGDLQDAQKFHGMIISVLPERLEAEPSHAVWMPFLKNGLATLESTAALIDHALRLGMRVLVHCEEGCERAPLTAAWFLHRRRAMTLEQAYALMKRQRPIVEDRRRWLGVYNR
jgi:protein-tyrosine phosphatase